ncbi:MAG: hypothetical protein ACLT76_04345 [Clostridium fessum]
MAETIITTEYSEEMQRSYMNYSMSVITAARHPGCEGWFETGTAPRPLRYGGAASGA